MAKRIIMLSPFDVLTGNLSGRQELIYGQDDTRAYEAANGSQGAKNYKPRFIGAKRADGTSYFSVRMKSTAVLNGKTRMAMGLTAITALIISSCKRAQSSATYSWAKIKKAFEVDQENGQLPEGIDSVTKFANYYIRRMLQYKQAKWFRQSASSPVELFNPYDLSTSSALVIKAQMWLKFADLFAFNSQTSITGGVYYAIDGVKFFAFASGAGIAPFDELITGVNNLNYKATITDLSIDEEKVKYMGAQVYTDAGEEVLDAVTPTADQKFTTIAPEP